MENQYETAFIFRDDIERCLLEEGLIPDDQQGDNVVNKFFDSIEHMGKNDLHNEWLENALMVFTDMLQWQIVLHLENKCIINDPEEEFGNVDAEIDAELFGSNESYDEVTIGTRLKLRFKGELTFRLYFDITRSIYQSDEQLEEALQELFSDVDDQLELIGE